MKVIIAPDKFKGSLTSFQVCEIVARSLQKKNKNIEVLEFPMADGGDGFASVMKHYLQTGTIYCKTLDPLGREIDGFYEWDDKYKIAIIEMAVASGLALLKNEERNPMLASTLGTGRLIENAIEKGAKQIILGLGGSATTDAGTGILAALGFKFVDEHDNWLSPSGKNLCRIRKIIQPKPLPAIRFQIASDVKNVLYGLQGAAYVFAPQKGAGEDEVKLLDAGLQNFASVIEKETGRQLYDIPATGAAGGVAAALMAFFTVEIRSGIDLIVNNSGIITQLAGTDLIITGEGKIDAQTGEGKVVGHIASLAREANITCNAVCGITELSAVELRKLGLANVLIIRDDSISEKEAMENAAKILEEKMAGDKTMLTR